jgi:nucleoside-triphosphatase THEP1
VENRLCRKASLEDEEIINNRELEMNTLLVGPVGSGKSDFIHRNIGELRGGNIKFFIVDTKLAEYDAYENSEKFEIAQWAEDHGGMLSKIEKEANSRKKNGNAGLSDILVVIDDFSRLAYQDRQLFENTILPILSEGGKMGISCIVAVSDDMPEIVTDELKNAFNRVGYFENDRLRTRPS